MPPLHIKYRPETLDAFEGNEDLVLSLQSLLDRKDDLPHAFLLTGPSGCGKTTIARIIKNHLNCGDADYYELDTADFRGIDMSREVRKKMQFKPVSGKCRIWLLDEVHMTTKEAQNALLKALEDTPNHVYFILATTNPEKLLPTIRNRCSKHEVQALSPKRIQRLLKKIIKEENADVSEEVIQQISRDCMGSCRGALTILDSVIDLDPEDQLKIASKKADEEAETKELCQALLKQFPWKKVSVIIKGIETEPETVRRQVLGYMSAVLLNSGQERASDIIYEFQDNFFDSGKAGLVNACFNLK